MSFFFQSCLLEGGNTSSQKRLNRKKALHQFKLDQDWVEKQRKKAVIARRQQQTRSRRQQAFHSRRRNPIAVEWFSFPVHAPNIQRRSIFLYSINSLIEVPFTHNSLVHLLESCCQRPVYKEHKGTSPPLVTKSEMSGVNVDYILNNGLDHCTHFAIAYSGRKKKNRTIRGFCLLECHEDIEWLDSQGIQQNMKLPTVYISVICAKRGSGRPLLGLVEKWAKDTWNAYSISLNSLKTPLAFYKKNDYKEADESCRDVLYKYHDYDDGYRMTKCLNKALYMGKFNSTINPDFKRMKIIEQNKAYPKALMEAEVASIQHAKNVIFAMDPDKVVGMPVVFLDGHDTAWKHATIHSAADNTKITFDLNVGAQRPDRRILVSLGKQLARFQLVQSPLYEEWRSLIDRPPPPIPSESSESKSSK